MLIGDRNGSLTQQPGRFEPLESRIVLSTVDNLPSLDDLETATNPVVVLETNLGDIYVELFPLDAPNTVANFLNYIQRGHFSETFFHRSAPNFVLQGGGFSYSDEGGFRRVFDETLGTIANEFGRSNLERTLAMAKFGGQPDSATSEFFINLNDNSGSLDDTGQPDNIDSGGFTVFGRVITEESWDVVEAIEALGRQDLRNDPAFQGQLEDAFGRPLFRDANGQSTLTDTGTPLTGNSALGGSQAGVPVRNTFSGLFEEEDQVEIVNAQIVKPQGALEFYTQVVAFPDGYASFQSRIELDVANPNDQAVTIQVVVRYEESLRDRVIFTGSLGAGSSRTILIHDTTNFETSLVRRATPFSIEVYTAHNSADTVDVPVAAALNVFDFGGSTGENGWNLTDVNQRSTTWDFTNIPGGPDMGRSFILWTNTTDTDGTVTVEYFVSGGAPFTQTFNLQAYRRGGVDLRNILNTLPAGSVVAARVTATVDIVASQSTFTSGDATVRPAVASLGVPFGGAIEGMLGGDVIPVTGNTTLSALNATNNGVIIQLRAYRSNGQILNALPAAFIMPARSRAAVNLGTVFPGIPDDEVFTIAYTSNFPVSLHARVDATDPQVEEATMTSLITRVGSTAIFSDGFLNFDGPDSANEFVSIFNPFANQSIIINIDYVFSDGAVISNQQNLAALGRIDIFTEDNAAVVTKVNSGDAFKNYSIIVRGVDLSEVAERQIVASLSRIDLRDLGDLDQVLSYNPVYGGTILALTDSAFDPGIGA